MTSDTFSLSKYMYMCIIHWHQCAWLLCTLGDNIMLKHPVILQRSFYDCNRLYFMLQFKFNYNKWNTYEKVVEGFQMVTSRSYEMNTKLLSTERSQSLRHLCLMNTNLYCFVDNELILSRQYYNIWHIYSHEVQQG